MALLAGWLVLCFVLASAFASRPVWLFSAAIIIRILVPFYASNAWMVGLHMAGYLVAATAIMQLVLYRPRVIRVLLNSKTELALFSVLVVLMLVNSVSAYSSIIDTLMNLAIIYLTPFTLYLLLKMEIHRLGLRAIQVISVPFHLTMLYEFWLAMRQEETGEILVYSQIAQNALWFQTSDDLGRSYGTLEGGLELSTLCVFAISMTYWVRNSALRIALIMAYTYTNLLGNGRAAVAIGIVVAIAVIVCARSSATAKIFSIVAGVFGFLFLYSSEAGQSIIEKMNNDGGSNQKRFDALTWVGNNFQHFIMMGYPGDRDLRASGQLSSSLENAYLIAAMGYGLIFSAILIMLQLYIVLRNARSLSGAVMGLAALGVIFVNMTNSGFTTNSNSAYLIWIALGLCTVGSWVSEKGYFQKERVVSRVSA
ncbi:hypothetical protein E4U03_02775 [Rothia nasimurium]|uniref:O-antigen ligase domain-containing protein n=1 Tax=Rothia nasimurium TaxID=85336 RepID=A0A4Y9F5L2_9MICC|nr:hypothetical protein [Rothia nasimurium]MBF0807542.1 hypothetical protein [Rothia nasimurium]TFU23643.1 hypothetical protein E4U03_02775 [Rothia nasimurium]